MLQHCRKRAGVEVWVENLDEEGHHSLGRKDITRCGGRTSLAGEERHHSLGRKDITHWGGRTSLAVE
jgi:hypothetical protein